MKIIAAAGSKTRDHGVVISPYLDVEALPNRLSGGVRKRVKPPV
jgi:hypothetical protein